MRIIRPKDASGEIKVEIDGENIKVATSSSKTKISVIGEVDKDWNSITIDVDY
jgi:uncharacterized protein YdeI (BOF family)